MLDTNIIIYLLKNKPPEVIQRLNALDDDSKICMSFVTYAELLKGAEKSTRKTQVIKQIKNLAQSIKVEFTTNEKLCESYATNFTHLKDAGTQIGANDLWIACHAISLDATLVTNNVREFTRIKQLNIENWVNNSPA
jgi:tRNA(fMet)-specific endonuclease VapC